MWMLSVFLRVGTGLFLGVAAFMGIAGGMFWLRGGAQQVAVRGVLWLGIASGAAALVLWVLSRRLAALARARQ